MANKRISNPLNPSVSVMVKLGKVAQLFPDLEDVELNTWLDAMVREGYLERKKQ